MPSSRTRTGYGQLAWQGSDRSQPGWFGRERTARCLGPDEVAGRIAASPRFAGDLAVDVRGQLNRLINDQFRDIAAVGPAMYASFLGAAEDDAERRHAHGTVTALGGCL
jgi:hypothetical protein